MSCDARAGTTPRRGSIRKEGSPAPSEVSEEKNSKVAGESVGFERLSERFEGFPIWTLPKLMLLDDGTNCGPTEFPTHLYSNFNK